LLAPNLVHLLGIGSVCLNGFSGLISGTLPGLGCRDLR
jgi:hypothetical protein